MRSAYLTDTEQSGLPLHHLLIAVGVMVLVIMVMTGLLASSDRKGLGELRTPDPLSGAAELPADQPIAEEATRYLLDKDAEYVGR